MIAPSTTAIQQGHRQGRIAEVIGPVLEVDVGDQRRRSLAAAAVNHLVEQTRRFRVFAAFEFVEAELVDDQQIEAAVVADARRQRLVAGGGRQVFQQFGAGDVAHAISAGHSNSGPRFESSGSFPNRSRRPRPDCRGGE